MSKLKNMEMKMIKIGFLPFYLELYDQTRPDVRPRIEQFLAKIKAKLEEQPFELISAPICRIRDEFAKAVDQFIEADVSAVITLHLAYSPSLESIDELQRLNRPLIMLDTTESKAFDESTLPVEIMYNHGIHGVQDLANLLRRRGLLYFVEAGHYHESDVLSRVSQLCLAAGAAHRMRRARVGIMGQPFSGMGDFAVPFAELAQTIGLTVIPWADEQYADYRALVTDAEISVEMKEDLRLFEAIDIKESSHRRSTVSGLVLRRWLEDQKLDAFSINFQAIDERSPLVCMPFLEISKSMGRGLGYAGEGDVLTASLCSSLTSLAKQVSFTEMFCPDWAGDSVFLSHMGEINPQIAAEKPRIVEMDFPYTSAENPIVAYARYRPGQAVLVNVAPQGQGQYNLILCPGSILDVSKQDQMADSIHGWFKPELPVAQFLQQYSREGGTHHLVLLYETDLDLLVSYGKILGFTARVIR